MSKKTLYYLAQFSFSLILSFIIYNDRAWFEIFATSIFVFFLIKFAYDLGSDISVKNIIAIIASMQWLLGPVMGYYYNNELGYGYQMSVPKEQYFAYVLPATLAYFLGLYIPLRKQKRMLAFKSYSINYYQKGVALILGGLIGGFLPFGFLAYLLGGLKYVGLFYMFASKNPLKYYWIAPVFGLLLYSSLGSAMFHELILWGCFFMMLYFIFRKSKFLNRINYMVIGLLLVLLVQFVKSDYRAALKDELANDSGSISLYWQVIKNKFSGVSPVFGDENVAANVVRINQGWIISRVMQNIPANESFANGETVKNAVIASILPRIVAPEKAIAGGRSNMEMYAGITLNETTSMDISQIGEAYANFGVTGGILFMFMLGLFFNLLIAFIEKKCFKYPDLIFWIPLIFLQAVKAETSLVTILNHVTKAGLVTWFFFSPWGDFFINNFFVTKQAQAKLLNANNMK